MSAKARMGDASMPAALRFMLAARRCELHSLQGLALTCELVTLISQLVHALQKERGYSNVYLGDAQPQRLQHLDVLSGAAQASEEQVRRCLEELAPDASQPADKARLFNRIAYALYSLEELPGLRRRILEQSLDAQTATAAFTRIVSSLLAMVFDAADTALDPDITRALVAMFNFMQGKELGGQERACGVAGFTAGYFSQARQAEMRHLLDSQQSSFRVFAEYADEEAIRRWEKLVADEAQVQQLREIAQRTSPEHRVDAGLAELWFDLMTIRIDAMREVESLLAEALLSNSRKRIAETTAELENHRGLLRRLAADTTARTPPMLFSVQGSMLDTIPKNGVGKHLERSILDLMREQTLHLQRLNDELTEARSALGEHKRIEQAKQLLINRYHLSEQQAHERLQRAAMDSGKRLVDVARQVIAQMRSDKGEKGEKA